MLRGLAEYSMSGRRQAATVAILFGLVPMLNLFSGAVVALVTLRRGLTEGFLVLLWAALPAGLQLIVGDLSPLMMLVSALLCGLLLRSTGSWPKVLLLITALGIAAQLSLALQPDYVAQIRAAFEQMMAEGMSFDMPESETGSASPEQLSTLLLQFYGFIQAVIYILCLVVARYWQALLYNPGGFREEFHALRMDPRSMVLLLGLLLAGQFGIAPLNQWIPLLCIAALVNGLALCHFAVAQRSMGANWLILAYLVVLFMAPAMIVLGFLDSFANLRKRIPPAE